MPFSEDDLRSALRRKEPSADFTAKVMSSIGNGTTEAVPRVAPAIYQSPWRVRWAMASVLAACLLVAGTSEYQMYRHKVEGEQAKEQAVRAMQITAAKMGHVFRHAKLISATNLEVHKEHL
jgi:hypothetical protein